MKGLLVVVALAASLASLASAEPKDSPATWSVRTLYSSLSARVGNPPDVLVYEIIEAAETGLPTERAALARARTIARDGLEIEMEGRAAVLIPPSRIELVEVYEIADGAK